MRLAGPVEVTGPGLHGGVEATLALRPAPDGSGPALLTPGGSVPIRALERSGRGRTTRLAHPETGTALAGAEHLLAALSGLDLWDVEIHLDGPEVPATDGSSLPLAMSLLAAAAPSPDGRRIVLEREVAVSDGPARLVASPAPNTVLDVTVDFGSRFPGRQRFVWDRLRDDFLETLAPARTFGFADEVERLRARGLALGGHLGNAVVFGPDGPLNPGGLRFDDEPARHKALDLLGDLAVLGADLAARVVARRPSHALNLALVDALSARLEGGGASIRAGVS